MDNVILGQSILNMTDDYQVSEVYPPTFLYRPCGSLDTVKQFYRTIVQWRRLLVQIPMEKIYPDMASREKIYERIAA